MRPNKALEAHYYELLGLEPEASLERCEHEYRRRLIEMHPDRYPPSHPLYQESKQRLDTLHSAIAKIRNWKEADAASLSRGVGRSQSRQQKLDSLPVQVRRLDR